MIACARNDAPGPGCRNCAPGLSMCAGNDLCGDISGEDRYLFVSASL